MSDNDNSGDMRPIPDGGLKDAMPSWLKRPPAWRTMPSAEERHERTLPEPDTSPIDPRTLVDVSDLPQWLQAIAERGPLPTPDPDEVVEHAVQQVHAAQQSADREDDVDDNIDPAIDDLAREEPIHTVMTPTMALASDETAVLPAASDGNRALVWALIATVLVIIALLAVIYTIM